MIAPARFPRGAAPRLTPFLLATGCATAIVLIARQAASLDDIELAALAIGIVGCGWLPFTRHQPAALVAVALYIGLLDGYLRLKTGNGQLTVVRDFLFYLLVVGAAVRVALRPGRLDIPPWTGWIVVFAAICILQLLNPASPSLQVSVQGLRPHLEWVPLFFFGYALMRTPARLRGFIVVLLLVAVANGVVGFVQFNLSSEELAGWGPGYSDLVEGKDKFRGAGRVYFDLKTGQAHVRPPALGPDTGFGGRVGFLAAPGALALLVAARSRKLKVLALISTAGIALAIITSHGRTSVVALFVALAAFAAFVTVTRRGARVIAALLIAAIAGYGVVSLITDRAADKHPLERYSTLAPKELVKTTTGSRGESLSSVPDYFTKAPLGVGLGRSGPALGLEANSPTIQSVAPNSETELNYLLSELGVPGLLALLGFSLVVIRGAIVSARRAKDSETRFLLAGVAAPLVAILVVWVATSTSATTPLSPYLWFVSGVIAYWSRRAVSSATNVAVT